MYNVFWPAYAAINTNLTRLPGVVLQRIVEVKMVVLVQQILPGLQRIESRPQGWYMTMDMTIEPQELFHVDYKSCIYLYNVSMSAVP
jgi:hypothetical protein